jgi:hypothetical protein
MSDTAWPTRSGQLREALMVLRWFLDGTRIGQVDTCMAQRAPLA